MRSGTHPHHTRSWYATSKAYLREHPWCIASGYPPHPATEVDHIIPGAGDDWSNLQPMCKAHHSQKTARSDYGFGRAPVAGG